MRLSDDNGSAMMVTDDPPSSMTRLVDSVQESATFAEERRGAVLRDLLWADRHC